MNKKLISNYLNAILQIRDKCAPITSSDVKHVDDNDSWIRATTTRGIFTVSKQAIRNTLHI